MRAMSRGYWMGVAISVCACGGRTAPTTAVAPLGDGGVGDTNTAEKYPPCPRSGTAPGQCVGNPCMTGETCLYWVQAGTYVSSQRAPEAGILFEYCAQAEYGEKGATVCDGPPWIDASLPYDEGPIGGSPASGYPYYAVCGCQ